MQQVGAVRIDRLFPWLFVQRYREVMWSSTEKWQEYNYHIRRRNSDQLNRAQRILNEATRLIDESVENSLKGKEQSDHYLRVKTRDLEYQKSQLILFKSLVAEEIECLKLYLDRVSDGRNSIKNEQLEVNKQCQSLRGKRLGIELCWDEVDEELKSEEAAIINAQNILNAIFDQLKERIRTMKALLRHFERMIYNKEASEAIDNYNLQLSARSESVALQLSLPDHPQSVEVEDWWDEAERLLEECRNELKDSRPMRIRIDSILIQTTEDLNRKNSEVVAAFHARIAEVNAEKTKLENRLSDTLGLVNQATVTIKNITEAIEAKKRFIALAQTRLVNRCHRPENEMCRDDPELSLYAEIRNFNEDLVQLGHILAEAEASVRYLVRTQVEVEESINLKTNTINIDQVQCMFLRSKIVYNTY